MIKSKRLLHNSLIYIYNNEQPVIIEAAVWQTLQELNKRAIENQNLLRIYLCPTVDY